MKYLCIYSVSASPPVAPYAGAWIEIFNLVDVDMVSKVAPYAGAWIEIISDLKLCFSICVAPYAGAWIEIDCIPAKRCSIGSLPTRERGLKLRPAPTMQILHCRSLRGSVD